MSENILIALFASVTALITTLITNFFLKSNQEKTAQIDFISKALSELSNAQEKLDMSDYSENVNLSEKEKLFDYAKSNFKACTEVIKSIEHLCNESSISQIKFKSNKISQTLAYLSVKSMGLEWTGNKEGLIPVDDLLKSMSNLTHDLEKLISDTKLRYSKRMQTLIKI